MVPDDSSRGYISECDLGKYYFYQLYIYVYFIKCNISFICISKYLCDFITCYVSFLCILEYPFELHDLYKDYPLSSERLQIEENILSDYQHHLLQDKGFNKPPPKRVPNLHSKTNYIIHYCNLKLYLERGLCLTNFHCVLSFDQSPWWKNYINFNIRQRATAKNDFERDHRKRFMFICSYILMHLFLVKQCKICGIDTWWT